MEPLARKRSLLSQLDLPTASASEPRQKDSQNAGQDSGDYLQHALQKVVTLSKQFSEEQQGSSPEQDPEQEPTADSKEVAEPSTPAQERSEAPLAAQELQDPEAVADAADRPPEEDGSGPQSGGSKKDWAGDQVLQGRAGRRSGTHAARMGTKEMAMRLLHVREGKLPSLADVPEAYLDTIGEDALEPLAAPSTWGQWRGARNLAEQLESGCLGVDASRTAFGANYLAGNSDSLGQQGGKAGEGGKAGRAGAASVEVAHPACQRVLDNWTRARRNMAACIIQAYFRGYMAKKRVARSRAASRRSSMHGEASDWLLQEDSCDDAFGDVGSKGGTVDDGTSGAVTDFASGTASGMDAYGSSSGGGSMGEDASAYGSVGSDGSKLADGSAAGAESTDAALAAQQAAAAQTALQLEMRNLKRKLCQNARDVLLAAQAQQAYSRTRQRLQYLSQSSRFVRIRRASSAAGPAIYEDAEAPAADLQGESQGDGNLQIGGTFFPQQTLGGDSLNVTLPSLSEELLQQAARLKVDVLPTLLEGGMEPRHARTVMQYSGLLSEQMETDLFARHKSFKQRQHVQRQLVMSVKPESVSKTVPWDETDSTNGCGTSCDTPPRQVVRQGTQVGVRRARFSLVNEASSDYPSPARSRRDSISNGGGLLPTSSSGKLPSSSGGMWPTSNSGKLPSSHPMSAFQMSQPPASKSERLRFSECMEPAPVPYQPTPPAPTASRSGRLTLRSRASEPCAGASSASDLGIGSSRAGGVTTGYKKGRKSEEASQGDKSEREAQAVEALMQLSSLSDIVPSEPKSSETRSVLPVPPYRVPITGTFASAISAPSLAEPKRTPRGSEPASSMMTGGPSTIPAASMPLFPVSRRSSLTCLIPTTRPTARQSESEFINMPSAFAATFKPGGGALAACSSEPGDPEGDLRLVSKQSGLIPTSALSRSSSKVLSGTLSRSTTLLPTSAAALVPSRTPSMVAPASGLTLRPSIPASVSSSALGMRTSLPIPPSQAATAPHAYMADLLMQSSTEPWATSVAESASYFSMPPDIPLPMTGLPGSRNGSLTSQIPSRSFGTLPSSSSRAVQQNMSIERLDKAVSVGGRVAGGSGSLATGSTPSLSQPFLPSSNSFLYSTSGTISSASIPSGPMTTTGTVPPPRPSLKQDKSASRESFTGSSLVVPGSKETASVGVYKAPKRVGDGPLGGDMPTLVRAGVGRRLSWTNPTLLAPKQG